MTEVEYFVIAGINSIHYHKPKWVKSKFTGNERLSTACGRDSAIYDIHISTKTWNLLPCKICYGKEYKE